MLNLVLHSIRENIKWYVRNYAAGVNEIDKKKLILVEYSYGKLEKIKIFLFGNDYLSVWEDFVVPIIVNPPNTSKKKLGSEKEKLNWGRILANYFTQATAIGALLVLIQRINK